MPISVTIARVGVFVSRPKALRMTACRLFAAFFIFPLFAHTSIPYVSCGSIIRYNRPSRRPRALALFSLIVVSEAADSWGTVEIKSQ